MANPYYRTEEEKAELMAMRDAFEAQFDAPAPTNYTILIIGDTEDGKTHLAATMSEIMPTYFFDTEFRAHVVIDKFKKLGRAIRVAAVKSYSELVAGTRWVIKNVKPDACVVVDSGTDLQKYSEEKYLDDRGREKMGMPITWPEMWSYTYRIMDDLKHSGFVTVYTAKVKDEFLNDARTGNKKPRVFADIPYRADIIVEFKDRVPHLVKAGAWQVGDTPIKLPKGITLPEIIAICKDQTLLPHANGLAPVASATPEIDKITITLPAAPAAPHVSSASVADSLSKTQHQGESHDSQRKEPSKYATQIQRWQRRQLYAGSVCQQAHDRRRGQRHRRDDVPE